MNFISNVHVDWKILSIVKKHVIYVSMTIIEDIVLTF